MVPFFTFAPHLGQLSALLLTSLPHSLHLISAMEPTLSLSFTPFVKGAPNKVGRILKFVNLARDNARRQAHIERRKHP